MREEDSSSPNDNLFIVSFTPRGTGGERWELHLSDGSSFFVSSEALQLAEVAAAELSPGEGLARGRAERLLACSRRLEARDKALELLVRRPHSVQELRLKLSRRRFASAEVDHALAWLDERGYLDDFRFAREWAEQRLARHPEGRLALTAGLRRRGVSREVAEEVIAGICSPESEREAAEAALSKLMPRGGAAELDAGEPHSCLSAGEIERLRRALQRRGFAAALILELLPRRPGRPE